eukprot:3216641-Pleurochrysis_carterae.AAC.1
MLVLFARVRAANLQSSPPLQPWITHRLARRARVRARRWSCFACAACRLSLLHPRAQHRRGGALRAAQRRARGELQRPRCGAGAGW